MSNVPEILRKMEPFSSLLVEHPLHTVVLEDLSYSIESAAGYEFIAVIGPTGVGKSTMAKECAKRALSYYEASGPLEPGELPAILVTSPAPPRKGPPSWKDLYSELLNKLNAPMASSPRSASFNVGFEGNFNVLCSLLAGGTTQGFRLGMCDAINKRKTRLIIIDEAQHLTRGVDREQVSREMDNLKNLAQQTRCLLVLFGTYDLMSVLDANDQLCRRVLPVHYPRYKEGAETRKLWNLSFDKFVDNIPLESKEILKSHREFYYRRTLGCIGTLDTALTWLAYRALRVNHGKANQNLIYRSTLIPGCSRSIRKAILAGEAKWDDLLSDDQLGESGGASSPEETDDTPPKPRPGTRRPGNDPVP